MTPTDVVESESAESGGEREKTGEGTGEREGSDREGPSRERILLDILFCASGVQTAPRLRGLLEPPGRQGSHMFRFDRTGVRCKVEALLPRGSKAGPGHDLLRATLFSYFDGILFDGRFVFVR